MQAILHIRQILSFSLTAPSADYLCKQYGPRPGPDQNIWYSADIPENKKEYWKNK